MSGGNQPSGQKPFSLLERLGLNTTVQNEAAFKAPPWRQILDAFPLTALNQAEPELYLKQHSHHINHRRSCCCFGKHVIRSHI